MLSMFCCIDLTKIKSSDDKIVLAILQIQIVIIIRNIWIQNELSSHYFDYKLTI